MRKIAIHQPNFIPWLPYFYKMAMADLFVVLQFVQFSDSYYQHRYKLSNGTWVSKSHVHRGFESIYDKDYLGMQPDYWYPSDHPQPKGSLYRLNMRWIEILKDTLQIKTEIVKEPAPFAGDVSRGSERLVKIIKWFGADVYLTTPEAKDKYLDEQMIRAAGIGIEYVNVPKHLRIHTFEAFERFGIDGVIKQMPREKGYERLSQAASQPPLAEKAVKDFQ